MRPRMQHVSIMCKWTQPFLWTDCQRSPKSLSSAQTASLCTASMDRVRKCLRVDSIYWDAVTVPTVCFSGVVRGRQGGGVSSRLRPTPSASMCSECIRDPDIGISRTRTLCKWPFSVVVDREWPGCRGIRVETSRIWKSFMQETLG